MSGFLKYGVPADGFAPDFKGERPPTERSGTLVKELGPNQLAELNRRSAIFADAARRAAEAGKS